MGISNLMHSPMCSEKFSYISEKGIQDALSKETGGDRLIRMYSTNEFGYSPEMSYVIQTGLHSVFIAGIYGGVKNMIKEKENHLRKNAVSTYESEHLARRSLTDKMTLAGLRGAAAYSVKYGAFSTIYLLSTMTIANYRNKMSPWEHAASAAVLGSLVRANYGFKGMLVAGSLGGVLGLVAGVVITTSMRLTGTTMDDLRCWMHEDYYIKKKKVKSDDSQSNR